MAEATDEQRHWQHVYHPDLIRQLDSLDSLDGAGLHAKEDYAVTATRDGGERMRSSFLDTATDEAMSVSRRRPRFRHEPVRSCHHG